MMTSVKVVLSMARISECKASLMMLGKQGVQRIEGRVPFCLRAKLGIHHLRGSLKGSYDGV